MVEDQDIMSKDGATLTELCSVRALCYVLHVYIKKKKKKKHHSMSVTRTHSS